MKFIVEARSVAATEATGWEEQACCPDTFHDVTVTSRLAKNI